MSLCVSQMAKSPVSRPADHLILQTQRREEARDQALRFTRDLQSCDVKSSWLQSGERSSLRGAVERRVGAELQQHQEDIHGRRRRSVHCQVQTQPRCWLGSGHVVVVLMQLWCLLLRLRLLLEAEEQQLLQETEEKEETVLEKQAKMRERSRTLRERREEERQQLVTDKMDQLFRSDPSQSSDCS